MPTQEEQEQARKDEIVQARRKAGYGTVTIYSPAPQGLEYGADDGQPLGLWAEGQSIPMRREEAESRDDCDVVEAVTPTVASPPKPVAEEAD